MIKKIFLTLLCFLGIKAWSQENKMIFSDNPVKSRLDSVVNSASTAYMANAGAVGLSIAIFHNGRNYLYNYGESKKGNKQVIKADQLFNLGSVAKTFTGILLAQAVVQKKARLDDDIRKYLPGNYANLHYQGHPIRLVDIANHTSGLPKSSRNFPANTMDSLKVLSLPEQLYFFEKFNQDTLLQDMHHFKLDTIPGTKYNYNGNAMTILILLLERIYQEPYEKIVTDYLITHHKMYNTRTKIPVAQLDRFMQGYKDATHPVQWYDLKKHPVTEINTNLFYPGGPSMNTTMSDMLKYLKANVVEKDSAIKLSHQQTYINANGIGVGLGWMIGKSDGKRFLYHSGKTGIGFSTLCSVYPEQGIGIMILVNETLNQDLLTDLRDKIKDAMK